MRSKHARKVANERRKLTANLVNVLSGATFGASVIIPAATNPMQVVSLATPIWLVIAGTPYWGARRIVFQARTGGRLMDGLPIAPALLMLGIGVALYAYAVLSERRPDR